MLVEVAARNQLLKAMGIFSAHEFTERLEREIMVLERETVLLRAVLGRSD